MNDEKKPETTEGGRTGSLLAGFIRGEEGNVLLEYVILIISVFVAFEVTTAPLQLQLIDFATDVFEHLHLP